MKIITLISLVALVGCQQNENVMNDLQGLQLKGKVKQVTQVTEFPEFPENEFSNRKIDSIVILFNEKGYITEVQRNTTEFSETDTLRSSIRRVYTHKSPTLLEIKEYDAGGQEKTTYTEKKDNNGMPLEIVSTNPETASYKIQYTYTKGRTEADVDITTLDGKFKIKEKVTFDEQGRILAEDNYADKEVVTEKTTYTYNDKGYVESSVRRNLATKSKYLQVYEYQYDSKGSATEIKEYGNGSLVGISKRSILYY